MEPVGESDGAQSVSGFSALASGPEPTMTGVMQPKDDSSTEQATETIPAGWGATVHSGGVAFRVWAPHADGVAVVGGFNEWDPKRHPCQREEGGNWFINIPEAKVGDEYRIAITRGEQSRLRIDPRARQVTNSVGNAVVAARAFDWQGDEFRIAGWNHLTIYEMHIGTFNNELTGGVGTFEGAIARLPHLQELGINAIELMPLAEFAGDFSWGYNPAHPYAVETAYGGPDGLKAFVLAAHQHGIAVLIDVVYNHFGPSDLDLWQFDGWSENGKGGIYFYNDWRSATPWGDTRPDYGREEVRQYIFDNAMMWLEDYHADGLRYDMTLYMRSVNGDENNAIPEGFNLAQWINSEIHRRYPHKITIAEDLRNNARLTLDKEHGGAHFGCQWDAEFVHPIREVITAVDDAHRSMAKVCRSIYHKYNHDVFERVIYTESHDEVANGKQRVVSEIDPSEEPGPYAIKRSTLGAALVFTAPGIPMIMQGQEFLRDKWFDDSRPIDWERRDDYVGIVHMYRDLIALRQNKAGCTAGLTGQHVLVFHVNEEQKLIAMRRWKEGGPRDDTLIVMNFADARRANYRIGLPRAGRWILRFNSDASTYSDHLDDTPTADCQAEEVPYDGFDFSAEISIGGYTCVIFSQD